MILNCDRDLESAKLSYRFCCDVVSLRWTFDNDANLLKGSRYKERTQPTDGLTRGLTTVIPIPPPPSASGVGLTKRRSMTPSHKMVQGGILYIRFVWSSSALFEQKV